jgi:hypothetical protein
MTYGIDCIDVADLDAARWRRSSGTSLHPVSGIPDSQIQENPCVRWQGTVE